MKLTRSAFALLIAATLQAQSPAAPEPIKLGSLTVSGSVRSRLYL